MNNDKTTDTASQGLIDWAEAMAARTDQGSLNWRVETSLLLGYRAAAKPLVAPAPDSALRDAAYEVLLGDQNCTTDEFAELLGDLQAALDAAPESEPTGSSGNSDLDRMDAYLEEGAYDDLKKQLAEATVERDGLQIVVDGIPALRERAEKAETQRDALLISRDGVLRDVAEWKERTAEAITRAEKAEATLDGNAGLRELRDLYSREIHGNGDYYAGCQAQRESFVGDIDRLLEAAPQPERDDPLTFPHLLKMSRPASDFHPDALVLAIDWFDEDHIVDANKKVEPERDDAPLTDWLEYIKDYEGCEPKYMKTIAELVRREIARGPK